MRSAEQMDEWLWHRGYWHWVNGPYSRSSRVPHELDYLHGMHSANALKVLANWMSAKLPFRVRLSGMWQDKYVYVRPKDSTGKLLAQRELADIAVILQKPVGATVERSMWLLQAKVATSPGCTFSGPSTVKEIDLLENELAFDLLDKKGGAAVLPGFAAHSFHGPKYWSFLTFHKNPTLSASAPLHAHPVRERWPGSTKPTPPMHQSFCEALLGVVNGTYGAPVTSPATDEWSRLYELLMKSSSAMPTVGHAKSIGNPTGSVMQFAVACGAMLDKAKAGGLNQSKHMYLSVFRPWSGPQDNEVYIGQGNHHYFGRYTYKYSRGYDDRAVESDAWSTLDALLTEEAFGRGGESDGPPGSGDGLQPNEPGGGPGVPFILFVDLTAPAADSGALGQ